MNTIILGDGPLGRAIEAAVRERSGDQPLVLGRPRPPGHGLSVFGPSTVVVDASRGDAVLANVEAALAGGAGRFLIATTGWERSRAPVDSLLRSTGASAVVAPNLSLGAAIFFRLVDRAAELTRRAPMFDPYVLEWHRRSKLDRPSGTAREIARRLAAERPGETEIAVIRAGSSPGMHLVGFDAPGETIELRLTARDRSAYAAGAIAAIDWLTRAPRLAGIHDFDAVVEELLEPLPLTATA
jgi:4-hydroxy-tetrahydrodipicolinate reductase